MHLCTRAPVPEKLAPPADINISAGYSSGPSGRPDTRMIRRNSNNAGWRDVKKNAGRSVEFLISAVGESASVSRDLNFIESADRGGADPIRGLFRIERGLLAFRWEGSERELRKWYHRQWINGGFALISDFFEYSIRHAVYLNI